MNFRQIHEYIEQAADEAQRLLDAEFARCNNQHGPGSALDQAGLRDGKEIVMDYLSHGEAGVALEHLAYYGERNRHRHIRGNEESHTPCGIGNAGGSVTVTEPLRNEALPREFKTKA